MISDARILERSDAYPMVPNVYLRRTKFPGCKSKETERIESVIRNLREALRGVVGEKNQTTAKAIT